VCSTLFYPLSSLLSRPLTTPVFIVNKTAFHEADCCCLLAFVLFPTRSTPESIWIFSFFLFFLSWIGKTSDPQKNLKNSKLKLKKLLPDKFSGPSGITKRMLQGGDNGFQGLVLILFNDLWEF